MGKKEEKRRKKEHRKFNDWAINGAIDIELCRQSFLKAVNEHWSDEDGLFRNEDMVALEVWELVDSAALRSDRFEIELVRK